MDYAVTRRLLAKLDKWEPLEPRFSDEENSEPEDSELDSDEDEDEDSFEVETPEQIVLSINRVLNVTWKVAIHKKAEGERWLKRIDVECIGPNGTIGSASSLYIDRDSIRSGFFLEMDEISQELSNLAGEVFDHGGFLNESLYFKGNQAWNDELDSGPLLVIGTLEINDRAMRRKGLGKALCKLLIAVARKISKLEDVFEEDKPIHPIITPGVLVSTSSHNMIIIITESLPFITS